MQQLVAIDDLQDAALAAAVAEIDPVELRHRDRPVQLGRHRSGRARLLAGQAEVANLHRMGRIAEIVNLGHPLDAPARHRRDQVADAGVAFPPGLVRVLVVAADLRQERRLGRIGDVPDLVTLGAEGAQHVELAAVGFRQARARAHPHHLGAAAFGAALGARNVLEIFRMRRIGHVDDRGAVELGLPGQRVDRLGDVGGAAVMADIGEIAVALMHDGRLIGAARLQVVVADQAHVAGFRRRADLLHLAVGGGCEPERRQHGGCEREHVEACHGDPPDVCQSRCFPGLDGKSAHGNGGRPAIVRASPVSSRMCSPVLTRSAT